VKFNKCIYTLVHRARVRHIKSYSQLYHSNTTATVNDNRRLLIWRLQTQCGPWVSLSITVLSPTNTL